MAENNGGFLKVMWMDRDITASVRSVVVEDHDRIADKATIELSDPTGVAGNVSREEQTVKIDLGWEKEHAVIFEGVITNPKDVVKDGKRGAKMIACDLSFRMTKKEETITHPEGKLSALVRSLFKKYSIPEGSVQVTPDPELKEEAHRKQIKRSDLGFIQDLAFRYGARAFVEVNDEKSKYYFVSDSVLLKQKPQGSLSYCPGFSQIKSFSMQRIAAAAPPEKSGSVKDPKTGKPVNAKTEKPEPTPPAKVHGPTASRAGAVSEGGSDRHGDAVDAAEGAATKPDAQINVNLMAGLPSDPKLLADFARRDPTRKLGLLGKGVATGTVMLRAKGRVTLTGVSDWADGDWYVRKVKHIYRVGATNVSGKRSKDVFETQFAVTR